MEQLDEQTTLRDTVAAAIDTVEAAAPAPEQQEAAPAEAAVTDAAPQETDAQRDERLRDEAGRFAKQPKAPVSAAQPPKATTPTAPKQAPSAPVAAETQSQAAKPKYPTTWKKGLEAHWDTLPPELHAEIMRRESDAARGVSVYKAEWDKARPIIEAVAPFMPLLQHHKIAPDQWISSLGRAHQTLALGTQEQRVQAFQKLAQDYGVPLQALTGQPDAQQQQPQQPARFQAPPALTREEVQQLIAQQTQEQTLRMMGQQEVNRLSTDGNHPHLQEVRETMAQLLEAGVIPEGDDALHQAYETAMALPQHRHLLEAARAEQQRAAEAKVAADKAALAARARSNAVSVRSSTPSSNFAQPNGDDSIRSALAAAIDQHGTGRI